MSARLVVAMTVLLASISCLAQVQPAAGKGKEILPHRLERRRGNGLYVGRLRKGGH